MQKHIILYVFLMFVTTGLLGQDSESFSYKLLETDDPQSKSVVQFYPNTSGANSYSWDFGQDGLTSTQENPTFEYDITDTTQFIVTLDHPELEAPIKDTIEVNPAYFYVLTDNQLGELASLKRLFRSAYMVELNETDSLGNMRFEWIFEGFEPANYEFNDPTMGHYPNVYHTFENGGEYTVTLRVSNVYALSNFIEYTQNITLEPVFGEDKVDFEDIPDVFTPNGDGINDFFIVETSGTSKLSFKVFSRSGSLVYEKDANVIKWDGKNYYGQDLPDGIYYYLITDQDGKYNPAKGFFYIYR